MDGAWRRYGLYLQETHNVSAAVRMYRRALASDPLNVQNWINLAKCVEVVGSPTDAIAAYRRVVQVHRVHDE
jgi:cytochrome c-type biogenesis protein CcmH/NrfG